MPRMTIPTRLVLQALLVASHDMYGREIGQIIGLPSGTVSPILVRLEEAGWVTSYWETVDAREAGRPPRRYYRLTDNGVRVASEMKPTPRW